MKSCLILRHFKLQKEDKRKDDSKDDDETEEDNNQDEYDPMEAEEAEDEEDGRIHLFPLGWKLHFLFDDFMSLKCIITVIFRIGKVKYSLVKVCYSKYCWYTVLLIFRWEHCFKKYMVLTVICSTYN